MVDNSVQENTGEVYTRVCVRVRMCMCVCVYVCGACNTFECICCNEIMGYLHTDETESHRVTKEHNFTGKTELTITSY